jgi:hypothetical protein
MEASEPLRECFDCTELPSYANCAIIGPLEVFLYCVTTSKQSRIGYGRTPTHQSVSGIPNGQHRAERASSLGGGDKVRSCKDLQLCLFTRPLTSDHDARELEERPEYSKDVDSCPRS